MRRKAVLILVLVVTASWAHGGEIVVGSLNMEWFGHGYKPRTGAQIATMADYIRSLEIDVLAVQEVSQTGDKSQNGVADWTDLLADLGPGYQGWLGKTGGSQRVGFIWRTERVELTDLGELNGIQREAVPSCDKETFPRIPVTAFVKSKGGGVDLRLIAVHLFATSDKARYAEGKKLNAWVKTYLQGNSDKDLIVIGDFNSKSLGAQGDDDNDNDGDSETIKNLEKDGTLTCVSKEHAEYTTATSQERYDHAALTSALLNGKYVKGSWDVRREAISLAPTDYKEAISNHLPVTLRISDDEDPDNDPTGDHGVDE